MADNRDRGKVTTAETSEAQIAVHWREEEYFYPSPKFVGQANLTDPDINERFSEKNFPECFREYADMLSGISTGTRRSIPVIRRFGSGSSEGS